MKYIYKYPYFLVLSALLGSTFLSDISLGDPLDATASTQEDASGKSADDTRPNMPFGEYLAGKFAETNGDSNNSVKFLRESLARDPNNRQVMENLYNAIIASGSIEEAIPVAMKLGDQKLSDDSTEFPPQFILAIEAAKHHHYDEAEKHLQNIPRAGFKSVLLPLLQAWLKLGNGEIKALIEPKDILPNGKMLLSYLNLNTAFINEIAGFEPEAMRQYEAAADETRLESPRAAEAIANYYYRKGMQDKYKKFVEHYAQVHGESVIGNESGNPAKIKPLVNNVDEGLAESLYTLASIFHGVRTPADEITTLRLALYLRPDFPAAEFLLAGAYELNHAPQEAIKSYKKIPPESSYYIQGRIMMAYDVSETGKKDDALADLDKIAGENPKTISALLAKGDILRTGDDFQHAIEAYDAAIARIKTERKPHWVIYFSRGICYDRLNNFEKTEADMRKALALSPGEPDVLNYLGYSWLVKHRNLAEAKKMVEAAYDARPEDAQIIDSMGYALYIDGDYNSAREYFEQALERIPNDPTINEHLGDTYWQLGRKTEAGYQWQRALDNKPDEVNKKALLKKLENGIVSIAPSSMADDKLPKPVVQ